MKKQVRLKIYGQVHGVFFRYNTQHIAQGLGLVGWVKNEPDGSVAIIAIGEENVLKKLIDWSQHGSGPSKVDKVDVHWEDVKHDFDNFTIKYY